MENNNKNLNKETENLYARESSRAINTPNGMASSVMKKAEISKKKNRTTLWAAIAVCAVVLIVLIVFLCVGAANRNKGELEGSGNDPVIEGTGGENGDANVSGNLSGSDGNDAQGGDNAGNSSGTNGDQSQGGSQNDNSQGSGNGSSQGSSNEGDNSQSGSSQGGSSSQGDSSDETAQGSAGGNNNSGSQNGNDAPQVDLSSQEKVKDDLEYADLVERVGLKGARILKVCTYDNNGTDMSWYQFYNACIDGIIDPHAEAPREYAHNMKQIFEENNMAEEAAQAENVLNAK